jgi:endonuclease G, mitochondrial
MPRILTSFLALLLAVTPGCSPETNPDRETNPNIRFGMPAPAKADAESSREAFLIPRPQYVLSYNAKTRTPNWACWRLRADDIGNAPRAPFEPDPALPKGIIARVTPHDYDGSGFDRGHMCPAKDRSASPEDVRAVFYMTNIAPQSPASNQRGWERLEDYCRHLVKEGHVLYIACGPYGVGGTGKDGYKEFIGRDRKINVPHDLWKVVLVLPREDAEPHKNTRVISIIMPNDQTVDYDWTRYRTSARKVEELTGNRFFRDVPDDVAEALRDSVDEAKIHVPPPPRSGVGKRRQEEP